MDNTATLMCTNMGGPNNTYQWQTNGTDIQGQTMDMLTLADVEASTGGMYTCVVTNAAGIILTALLYYFSLFHH